MLTKEYRLIVENGTVVSAQAYNLNSVTHVPDSKQGYEFDTEQEMLDFIESNGFVITEDFNAE